MNRFDETLGAHGFGRLRRGKVEILQINVGKLCNLTCAHCHVNAGPGRKEVMTRATIDRVVDWLGRTVIPKVDITGGAPEMIPDFRYLVERLKALKPSRHLIDRCNLVILLEPGFEWLADFLKSHQVEIIASLPCYSPKNVDAQRGKGVFERSIAALQKLNSLGYGSDPALPLHLVYNPLGASLPPEQNGLEADYKIKLKRHFNIVFNRLYTITNMPIERFATRLRKNGAYERYLQLLIENFNVASVDGLMCRSTLSVGWRGEVYDCDFNQMLDLPWHRDCNASLPLLPLWDLGPHGVERRPIMTGDHCFGCTAGSGSSCNGALASKPQPPKQRQHGNQQQPRRPCRPRQAPG